ncbi:MAG TPA: IPT/TIG domain-containing protein [Brevundimonas sp.]|jgi:uncharacterized protein YhjY with autotransporter beta-barrel domain|uniref:IPT/TIG domain-containing protein n=1 Tax=Brevundimonas sp. TaxID=1871086 RepID=UPI002DEFAF13|nr:IPT/TIG domain-containing protein [Brevundimonas sp.]
MFGSILAACGLSARVRVGARRERPTRRGLGAALATMTILLTAWGGPALAQSAGCTAINNGALNHTVRRVSANVSASGTTANYFAGQESVHNIQTQSGGTDPTYGTTPFGSGYSATPLSAGEQIVVTATTTNFASPGDIVGVTLRGTSNAFSINGNGSSSSTYTATGSETYFGIRTWREGGLASADISFTASCTQATPSVSITVGPASVSEDGATNLTYTVTRSVTSTSALTVNLTTTGTATSGTDYTGGVASVTIPANATTATVTIDPTVDGAVEANETVTLTVASGAGYTVGSPASATGTILNDDVPSATIAVSPASVAEDGAPNLVYTITLNQAALSSTSVGYTITGTATNGTDYATIASPLVIPAGNLTGTITVNPTADATIEANETVTLTLGAGAGYTVGVPNAATGTILNDDLPNLTINDVTANEGSAGTTNFTFTVSLSAPAGPGGVTFDIGTADGTATVGADYVGSNLTGQTIPAGSSTYTFTVSVYGNTTLEPSETFFVNVTNVVNAIVVDGQGVGTIVNDDVAAPVVTSIAPTAGPTVGGTIVTITGTNLSGATAVAFGANPATGFTVNSATQITATAPAGTGTVNVTVTTASGTSATGAANEFTYRAAPTVTALAPTSGPTVGGTSVTISGTNFAGTTAVSFGATAATAFTVNSNTQIVATAPAGSGTVDVRVTTAGGTSATSAADQFTYQTGTISVVPTATNLASGNSATVTVTPSFAPPSGSLVVTLNASGSAGGTLSTSTLTFTNANPQTFTFTAGAPSGLKTISYSLSGASGAAYAAPASTGFTVTSGTISVTGVPASMAAGDVATITVTPSMAPPNGNLVVTLSKSGLSGTLSTSSLTFTSAAPQTFTFTATAPAGNVTLNFVRSGTDALAYAAPAGVTIAVSAPPAPTISFLGPNSGSFAGGTPVTIFGTNFTGATGVSFGGTPATNFAVQGATQIIATSPAGAVGPVNVTVTTPGGTSSGATYTYVLAPTISAVSPAEGPASATTRPADVTITGSNFSASGNMVQFGGTPGTIVSESASSIVVTPPANGTGGLVNVTVFDASYRSGTAVDAYRYVLPPVVTVSFGTSSIVGTSGTTGFSVTLTNPNPVAIRGARVASNGANTPFFLTAFGTFCGGSGNYNASSAFVLSGVDLAANGSCTATSTQQPTASGSFQFVTAPPTATGTATTTFTLTGAAATSNTLTVQRARPSITGVSPATGPQSGGTNVTLTGSNLTGTTAVTVGGVAATNVTVVSDTQVTFTTAAAPTAGAASISATNSVGTGTLTSAFAYIAPPVITTISPAVTSTAGGGTITLNGSGLGSSTVTVDGAPVGTVQNTGSLRSFTAPAHAAGTVNVIVTTGGGSATAQLTYVNRPTANAQTVAVPYGTATGITVTGSDPNTPPQPLTYSIANPPSNGVLSGAGPNYTYTPLAGRSGADSFTFVASNGGATSSPATVTLNVGAPTITLTPTTVPDATAGIAYSQTLTASGGAAPYAYAVTAGALPAGLSLSTGGVLSGTPTAGGAFTFSVTATDSSTGGAAPFTATRVYSLTVQAPTIVVSPNTLPGATRGVAYSQPIAASGGVGPLGFAVTAGALPGGLTLSPSGVLSGIPSTTGVYNFTIAATDQSTGSGPYSGSRAYSLNVGQGAPVITGLSVAASHQFQTTPVTITGSEFTGATSVLFGTAPAASFTVVSDTRIDAVVPVFVPAGVVNVSVATPGGTSADAGATDDFRFIGRPLVTSVSPSTGGTPGGASLTVSGQNFTGATSVVFSVPAAGGASNVVSASSFVVVDDATLTVVTPNVAGIAPNGGVAEIVVANPSGEDNPQAGPQDDYTFVGQPSAAMLDVTEGPVAGGTRVTVTGQRLGTVTGVTVGGVAATNVVAGATSVAFDTPAGTGVQPIVLTWTYGAVPAQSFSYLSAPNTPQIVQAPPSLSASSTAQFTLSGVSIEASLDGAAFTPIAAQPVIFTGLTDGPHVVRFRSANAGGVSGEVSHAWTIDTVAPAAPVVTAPVDGARVLIATPTFSGTAEADARVSIAVDGTGLGTVTATGGAWSFTPSTGLAIGPHVVVATATDAAGNVSAASSTVRFTYNPISVNTAALPNARVGVAYATSVTATGGTAPYAFSVVGGALPNGVVLSTSGALSGTPTASGTFGFTVRVMDAGGVSADGAQTLVVEAPVVPDARPTVVTVPATSTTGPTTIDLSAQTANAARIEIVTPPAHGSATVDGMSIRYTPQPGFYGTVTFTYRSVGYADGGQAGVASAPATVTVTLAAPTLVLSPSTLPAGRVAVAYSQTVSASGGTAPYTYAVTGGALPAGLTLSGAGQLSGAPTAGGTFNFTVTATDSSTGTGPFTVSQSYALTVAASTIVVSPASLPAGTRGTPYSAGVGATGGVAPYAYAVSAGAPPTGLTLSTAGVLSGTPTAVGSFTFTVTARDSAGGAGPYTGSATYTVTISALTLTVTPTALPPVLAGTAFSQQMSATGGRGTYSYAVTGGALPSGLTLTTGGLLSGRPSSGGTFAFTITATDSFGNTGGAALTLTVTARPDPAADPDVQGLTAAEADAARRFSQSQIGNFTRRLEQIRRGGGASGAFNVSLDGSAFMSLSDDEAVRGPLAQAQGGQGRTAGDRFGVSGRFDDREALRGLLTAGAPDRQRLDAASAVPTAAAQAGPGGVRVWAGGAISLGERDATTRRAELDIRTGGLSVGADMSVSDQLDVGLGVGFGQEDTDVGSTGTRLEAETWVGVGYLTWRPDDRVFVDGILGYGSLSYDTRRRTPVDQSLVFGQREGEIVFAAVTGGIDHAAGPTRWSVYGRAEGMTADLEAFTETGSPLWALSYDDRSVQSLQGVVGVRWERDFGVGSPNVWSPGLRFELSNEFADADAQTLRYADWLDGPSYGFVQDGWSRTQGMVGVSLGLTGEHGWSVRGEAEGRTRGDELMGQFRMLVSRKF